MLTFIMLGTSVARRDPQPDRPMDVTTERAPSRFGSADSATPVYAAIEILAATALIVAGLKMPLAIFAFGSAPWMAVLALLIVGWRKPNVLGIGLRTPASIVWTIVIGVVVGVGYQFLGTFIIEPALARVTGELPDVSGFRPLVGNVKELASWVGIVWPVAAFAEEVAYRGWLLTRLAELGRFSKGAWVGAAIGSSVVFGLLHAYQGTSGMIATGLTGVVFAIVYLATGRNLWAAIIAHGMLDTTGFVLMYLGKYPGM